MKKFTALCLALLLVFSVAGCAANDPTTPSTGKPDATTPSGTTPGNTTAPDTKPADSEFDPSKKSEGVMTYEEYAAAELESEVVVETFVQAKQGWWEKDGVGVATFYTQDTVGAYFVYNMPCSKEDYDKLVPGTRIKVTGTKTAWSGEVEIIDAKFEIMEGTYIAPVTDVTEMMGKDELINHQNKFVSFKGMTVEPVGKDDKGNNLAFMYKYNGSGQDGDDLYFKVSLNGKSYTFTVESYLCDKDSEVYAAVKNLKIGDVIDMEGFLYWYEGANPHITSVTVKTAA